MKDTPQPDAARRYWSRRYGRVLTTDETTDILHRLGVFASLLETWSADQRRADSAIRDRKAKP